jgi:hypothetical protein
MSTQRRILFLQLVQAGLIADGRFDGQEVMKHLHVVQQVQEKNIPSDYLEAAEEYLEFCASGEDMPDWI